MINANSKFIVIIIMLFAFFLLPKSLLSQENQETAEDQIPSVRISKLKIKGGEAVTKEDIQESIGTDFPSIKPWAKKPEFDEEILKDDLVRIKRLYANNGYYDAQVTYKLEYNKDKTRVKIEIDIDEGEPIELTKLNLGIRALDKEIQKEIRSAIPLKEGKVFSPNAYQQTKNVMSEVLANDGYPKSDIKGEALVNRREKWAKVKFNVEPGESYNFGVTKIRGNKRVKAYIVNREATYKKGESYSAEKVNETQAKIFQLGLFRSVVIDTEYEDEENIANIIISVKERKLGSIKVGGGFGTEDKLRGQIIWTQRNFFGDGRRFELSGKFSFITQRVEAAIFQPFVWGRDSELSASLNFQRDDVPSFTGQSFLSSGRFSKDFKKYYSSFGSFNIQFSKVENSASRTPEEQSRENFFLTFFNFGLERDTTDSLLNPTRGSVVSTGLESSFTALASDVNYLKGTIELRGYKKLYNVVFAKRLTTGVIQPFGSTGTLDIPIFKRFFAGGSTSMRGFPFQKLGPLDQNNDPLGGNTLFVGSFEVRFPIYGDFGGVAFLDYGNVFTKEWDFQFNNLKYAPGAGLRYDTIIGPVRFDVGYALNPEPGIRRVQFFISIGQAF